MVSVKVLQRIDSKTKRMTVFVKPEGYAQRPVGQLLAEQCVLGDEKAWVALHRQYFPTATTFLRRLGVAESDLEDAAQEVFVQVFRYLPRFREQAAFRTWLYQLCVTQARQARRLRYLRNVLDRVLARRPVAALVSSPAFSEELAQRQIDTALAGLSDAHRTVFVLYELEGVSGKEIAKIVGAKEATVWQRLHHARQRFRAALGLEAEGGS
jgi:RNA polymerase sigma factor (sigma-70 family)